jgi:ribosomal-protein-alanine N-acetyltransferase
MEELRIRKAVDADLQEIIRIWKRNIKTINTASDIADLFYSFKNYFLVAVYSDSADTNAAYTGGRAKRSFNGKNKVLGFVGGTIRSGHGHISGIAVDKEYRLQEIGKNLLGTVERKFFADNFDRVTLEVRKSNRGAISFYEKQGYKQLYIIKGYYADGEDAIVYEKKL